MKKKEKKIKAWIKKDQIQFPLAIDGGLIFMSLMISFRKEGSYKYPIQITFKNK